MPILAEPAERPGCLPSSKDEPFLPAISDTASLDSVKHGRGQCNNNNTTSSNNSIGKQDDVDDKDEVGDSFCSRKGQYCSAPGSVVSTPFKLPNIDRSKSHSVSSLSSDHFKGRGRSRDRRSKLCRSPSCPSNLGFWQDDLQQTAFSMPDTPDTARFAGESTPRSNSGAYNRPYFTHREDSSSVKLPNIYQHRGSANASFALSGSTANSSTHTSREPSPFSFKREATFLGLARKDLSPDGTASQTSPRHETELQRSHNQNSAVLLPISSGAEARNSMKAKRKRKKANGLIASMEENSEAEKLLREKLGAIERRDEKTDLSDTGFIEKVKDETVKANGASGNMASENLTSKPPIYQHTPARIKTEKKIASVKA